MRGGRKTFVQETCIFRQIECSTYLQLHNHLLMPVLFVPCFPAAAPSTLNAHCFTDRVQPYVYGGSGPLKIIQPELI